MLRSEHPGGNHSKSLRVLNKGDEAKGLHLVRPNV
jgi:hypothetical protein